MTTVILDAGHGGFDSGAIYNDRLEKDDNLALTLAIGDVLSSNGVNVLYTRTTDIYETPTEKALESNESGADYFISIHRNASPFANQYTGIESLVYNDALYAYTIAENINKQLESVGFINQGIQERPNLAVLRKTSMPAVLVEVGFLNNDLDNLLFDAQFNEIANAIAVGILESI
ncbi:MAG: N-acetylmuramoyl-L-alanine amidase [Lachnospiraceae bacterium]